MRNLSMFKLSRFRQVSEQSLYRSVLICNTLKSIDREIEQESKEASNATEFHQNHYNNSKLINNNAQNELHSNQPNQYSSSDNSNSNFNQPFNNSVNNNRLSSSVTTIVSMNESITPYDHPLKEAQSGRATPFPLSGPDTDSGFGDEDCTRPINWGSVLSLSSQSALDPLNNNDLFTTQTTSMAITQSSNTTTLTSSSSTTNWEYNLLDMDLGLGPELTELLPSWKLTPLSADDILKSVSPPLEPSKVMLESEIDSFTHIMVGS